MPINRINQDVQARSPGMILHSGRIVTTTGGAILTHTGDPGVTASKTGTGAYEITFPAEGDLFPRDSHAICDDAASFTRHEISGDGTVLTITTLNGAPAVPGAGGGVGLDSVTYHREADTGVDDEMADRVLWTADADGTFHGITVTLEDPITYPGPELGTICEWFAAHYDNSAQSFPTDQANNPYTTATPSPILGPGGTQAILALGAGPPIAPLDQDRFTPMAEYIPYSIPIEPFSVSRGDVVTVTYTKGGQGIILPYHMYTAHWTTDVTGGGGGSPTTGVATDFADAVISYHVWYKNCSAR